MTTDHHKQGEPAGIELYVELGQLILAGKVSHAVLATFVRQFRDSSQQSTNQTYPSTLAAAIARCGCEYNSADLTADTFGSDILGMLGVGYVLGKPTMSEVANERGHWVAEDFDAWLAGPEVAGKGLEAAYLVDLCEYGCDDPFAQLSTPVLCWRSSQNGLVTCLWGFGGKRHLSACAREGYWQFNCRVLLREVSRT